MPENQRQKQKALTKSHIIETAMELFSQNGFANTSTLAISKAAKVSHGTIFAHFKTQEELLTAVINEFGVRVNSRMHELAGARSGVREILEAHLEGLAEFEEFYTRLVIESRILPSEARYTFTIIQSTVSFHISQALEREISEGSIQNLPIHMLFNGWVAIIHYYLTNNDLFSPGESVLKRYGKELVEYYMALITNKSSERK